MPPRTNSRYFNATGVTDADGRRYLTEVDLIAFRAKSDNRYHTVKSGETPYNLAGKYFYPLERAAGLWWIIAMFQTPPVIDPTVPLPVGTVLVIPSISTVVTEILTEAAD